MPIMQGWRSFIGAIDITPDVNMLGMDLATEAPDNTRLTWTQRGALPGLHTAGWSVGGFFNGPVDDTLWSLIGTASGRLVSMLEGNTVGSVGYMVQAHSAEYTPFKSSVGENVGFSLSGGAASDTLARSVLAVPRADDDTGVQTSWITLANARYVPPGGGTIPNEWLLAIIVAGVDSGADLDVTLEANQSTPRTVVSAAGIDAIGTTILRGAATAGDGAFRVTTTVNNISTEAVDYMVLVGIR